MIFMKWHLIQSNFMEQISFQLSNTLLLANFPHKKRRYRMTDYNQSWFENIWIQRYGVLINEIWQKEFKMRPHNFKHLLNMNRPGIEKMEFFNWDCLPYCRSLSNSLICFFICITVLGWACLSTNSLTFKKAEGCLNVSVSLYKCFQEFTDTAACCFDQISFSAIFLTSYLFFITTN